MSGVDAKLPAYNTQPLTHLGVCFHEPGRCFEYSLGYEVSSAKELFSASYRRAPDFNQQEWETLIAADDAPAIAQRRASKANCMIKPGFNVGCSRMNLARIGFCGTEAFRACEQTDSAEA